MTKPWHVRHTEEGTVADLGVIKGEPATIGAGRDRHVLTGRPGGDRRCGCRRNRAECRCRVRELWPPTPATPRPRPPRFHVVEVGRVVAVVRRADKDGAEPNARRTQVGDVAELIAHAPQRATADATQIGRLEPCLAVARIEAVYEDLVDDRVACPLRRAIAVHVVSEGVPTGRIAGGSGRPWAYLRRTGRGLFCDELHLGPVSEDFPPGVSF